MKSLPSDLSNRHLLFYIVLNYELLLSVHNYLQKLLNVLQIDMILSVCVKHINNNGPNISDWAHNTYVK